MDWAGRKTSGTNKATHWRLAFFAPGILLACMLSAGAQDPSPIDVQVLPSLNGETPVQISIKSHQTSITLELPQLRPVSIQPQNAPSTKIPTSIHNAADRASQPLDELSPQKPVAAPQASVIPDTSKGLTPITADNQSADSAEEVLRRRMENIKAGAEQEGTDTARQDLQKLAADFPGSAVAPEALFFAAQLEKHSAQNQRAEFLAIAEGYPNTVWAARSYHEIGQAEVSKGNHQAALEAFRAGQALNLQENQTNDKHLSQTSIIQCLFELGQYEEALADYGKIEGNLSDDVLKEKMMDIKTECLMGLRRYDEAIIALKAFVDAYANSPLAPKALLCQGLCFEQIGQGDQAREIFDLLLRKYGHKENGDLPVEAKFARERLDLIGKELFP